MLGITYCFECCRPQCCMYRLRWSWWKMIQSHVLLVSLYCNWNVITSCTTLPVSIPFFHYTKPEVLNSFIGFVVNIMNCIDPELWTEPYRYSICSFIICNHTSAKRINFWMDPGKPPPNFHQWTYPPTKFSITSPIQINPRLPLNPLGLVFHLSHKSRQNKQLCGMNLAKAPSKWPPVMSILLSNKVSTRERERADALFH